MAKKAVVQLCVDK